MVEMEGRETIMLGSNNYLGLTGDPRVKQAARDALETYGTGAHRLAAAERDHAAAPRARARAGRVDGDRGRDRLHHRLPGERRLHRHDPRARRHRDLRLGRPRLDPRRLQALRRASCARSATTGWTSSSGCWSARRATAAACWSIVDGVFSMEGDLCDLPPIVELCQRYGARLMVDEAHGVGVLGARGAGACELFGLEDEVDLRMGTFSKSLASCGGFIAGPAEVVEYLRISSRAVHLHRLGRPGGRRRRARRPAGDPRRGPGAVRAKLLDNARYLRQGFRDLGLKVVEPGTLPDGSEATTPVVPVVVGEDWQAVLLWKALFDAGVYTNVADPPGGPARRSAAADHPDGDPRARAPRPRPGDHRANDRRVPGPPPRLTLAAGAVQSPHRGRFALSSSEQGRTCERKRLLLANDLWYRHSRSAVDGADRDF